MYKIPCSNHDINTADIKAVVQSLKSSYITTGPKVIEFEKKLSKNFGAKYAVSLNSATSAMHLACLALGLKKNDYLWTSPISFVASSNCGLYCDAKIQFVDIDKNNFNLCPDVLKAKLIATDKKKLPKIVVVVHLAGNPIDMKKIKKLSRKYKFKTIEDASHAAGSVFNSFKIGSCKYSDACIFSFHPVKTFTTGEGGAVLTNSKTLFEKITSLRSHGIRRNKKETFLKKNYDIKKIGFNFRMSDIHAALGISQLKRINQFVKARNQIANYYKNNISSSKIKFQKINKNCISSMHLLIIKLPHLDRNNLYKELKKNSIQTNLHYIPIYRHSLYKKFKYRESNFPNSEKYYQEAISLPIYYSLSIAKTKKIISIINRVVS